VIVGMLDRERGELSSCETNLNTREATLETDQKSLADSKPTTWPSGKGPRIWP
jgi:hypothetical protein